MNPRTTTTGGWLHQPRGQESLSRYIETIRERIWIIVAAVAITTGGAALYLVTADPVYEAQVDILVSPVDDESGTLTSLGLISSSGDPLRAVETAAGLLTSKTAAELTAKNLGVDRDPDSILSDVSAEPLAESNIVTLSAQASTGEEAAELADAFAKAAISTRTKAIRGSIDTELPVLQARIDELPTGATRETIAAQIAQLEALRASGDPTLRIIEPASVPDDPVSPRPLLSLVAGILAGLVIGIGIAFALRTLDPLLRSEDDLKARYSLPILARVPQQRSDRDMPLVWGNLLAGSIEAYRTLRAVLTTSNAGRRSSTSILITSPGPGEGKTTSAISLAASLALTHEKVILIEADLRRPTIGKAFGISASTGVASVLAGEASLSESLVNAPIGDGHLALLLAEEADSPGAELLALPTAHQMIAEAESIADIVVIDSPPLATVIDALPLAEAVDEVLLVLKLGTTRLDKLEQLAEILVEMDVRPAGFALIGVPGQRSTYYGRPGGDRIVALSATKTTSPPG